MGASFPGLLNGFMILGRVVVDAFPTAIIIARVGVPELPERTSTVVAEKQMSLRRVFAEIAIVQVPNLRAHVVFCYEVIAFIDDLTFARERYESRELDSTVNLRRKYISVPSCI
ncbi:hypothetical protein GGS26DRAFT_594165 [Hypomontagnella submonticulosa]|nr:hypothetical protein GGS26DRAFT_594165 [Hypomontagnella submonticulosa]